MSKMRRYWTMMEILVDFVKATGFSIGPRSRVALLSAFRAPQLAGDLIQDDK